MPQEPRKNPLSLDEIAAAPVWGESGKKAGGFSLEEVGSAPDNPRYASVLSKGKPEEQEDTSILTGDAALDAVLSGNADPARVDRPSMMASLESRLHGMKDGDKERISKFLDSHDEAHKDTRGLGEKAWDMAKAIPKAVWDIGAGIVKTTVAENPKTGLAVAKSLLADTDGLDKLASPELAKYATQEGPSGYGSNSALLKVGIGQLEPGEESRKAMAGAVLDALVGKFREKGEDGLTEAERKFLPAIKASHEADARLNATEQGVREGIVGAERLAAGAAANAFGSRDFRLKYEAGVEGQRKRDNEKLGGDKEAEEARGNVAAAASLLDPGNEALGGIGKVGSAAFTRIAPKVTEKVLVPVQGAIERIGTNSSRATVKAEGIGASRGASGVYEGVKHALNDVQSAAGDLSRGRDTGGWTKAGRTVGSLSAAAGSETIQFTERMLNKYGDAGAGVATEMAALTTMGHYAGQEDPESAAAGILAGHLIMAPVMRGASKGYAEGGVKGAAKGAVLEPVRSVADLAATVAQPTRRDRAKTGLDSIAPTGVQEIDKAVNSAYESADSKTRSLIQAQGRAARRFNAGGTADSLVLPIPVKTAAEASRIAELLNERLPEGQRVDFDPAKRAGFSVELPADSFGDPKYAGKKVVLGVSYTDSPLFKQASADEIAHGFLAAVPEKFINDVAEHMTEADAVKLRDAGVPDANLKTEWVASQFSQFLLDRDFSSGGLRQNLADFFSSVGGGRNNREIGTYGLQGDRAAYGMFAKAVRNPESPLSRSGATPVHLYENNSAPVTLGGEANRTPASPAELRSLAGSFDRNVPQKSIAANLILDGQLTASMSPADMTRTFAGYADREGFRLNADDVSVGVDKARELLGMQSVRAERTSKAEATLATKAMSKRVDALLRRADTTLTAITPDEIAKMNPGEVLSPEEIEVLDSKVAKANRAIERKLAEAQKRVDAAAAKEDANRYEAWWNQKAREARDAKAASGEAKAWNEALAKQEAENAKAAAKAAFEESKSPELRALEAAKGDLASLGISPTMSGQVNRHLRSNLTTLLSAEGSSILEAAKSALAEVPQDATPADKRKAVLSATAKLRELIVGEQGLEVLTNPEVSKHPPGITPAQWDAVVKHRGHATIADAAGEAATKAIQKAIEQRNASSIRENGAATFDADLIGEVGSDLPRAEKPSIARAIPKYDSPAADEVDTDFTPGKPIAEPVDAVNSVLRVKVFSKAPGEDFAAGRRPWSSDMTEVRRAVAGAEGITPEELNAKHTTKEILERAKGIEGLSEIASDLLGRGADREHTVVVLGDAVKGGVVPVFDLTQFSDNLNGMLKALPSPGKTALKKALGKVAPEWNGKAVTEADAKAAYGSIAAEYAKNGKTLSGVLVSEGVPSPEDVGTGLLTREESFLLSAGFGGAWSKGGAEGGKIVPRAREAADAVSASIRGADRTGARIAELGDLSAGFHENFTSPQDLAAQYRLENAFHTFAKAELAKDAKPIGAVPYVNTGTEKVVFHGDSVKPGIRPYYAGTEAPKQLHGDTERTAGVLGGINALRRSEEERKKALSSDNIQPKK